ncbi:unnamed protein product, partial [Phaeothamnion confervicola]
EIPDADHVLRYIGKKHVDNGVVNGTGFLSRPAEDSPSVNWMERFDLPLENQVKCVADRRRIRYEKRARLVRLNVGATKDYVRSQSPIAIELSFVSDPLEAENGRPADISHALIRGVPTVETPEGEAVKDLFSHCILNEFAVTPD